MIDSQVVKWIISITIGIVMFFIITTCFKIYDKKNQEHQINTANKMVINRLRSYVVDNDLPAIEIINAVKASIAREYNVKYDKLYTSKTLCEELINDILGNSYISKHDQKKYIDMLNNYLKQDDILANDTNESSVNKFKPDEHTYSLIDNIVSIIASIVTILSTFVVSGLFQ